MKILNLVFGMGFIILGLVIYLATWFVVFPLILPEGHYPVILAAIPALPLIWPAWLFLKRAGIQWGTYPTSTTRLTVIAFIIFFAVFMTLALFGVFDD